MVFGYFAGREHIKYEIRSAVETGIKGIQQSLKSGIDYQSSEGKDQAKIKKPSEPAVFKVSLLEKNFREANYSTGISNAITFAVSFQNLMGKDIRAFDGSLQFTDLLDNTILKAGLAVNDPVDASSTLKWKGELDYNQFRDSHKRLRNANLKI